MSKQHRHRLILDIIDHEAVGSQTDLRDRLADRGFNVNQATLSRDLKELRLVKISEDGVRYRYVRPEDASPGRPDQAIHLLRQFVRRVEASGTLVVVSTELGNAGPIAVALDRLKLPGLLGTVAGDDTVLVVVSESVSARAVRDRLWALVGDDGEDDEDDRDGDAGSAEE